MSWGHWALIVLSLVGVSLLASVALELMKKLVRYDMLSDRIIEWVKTRVFPSDR